MRPSTLALELRLCAGLLLLLSCVACGPPDEYDPIETSISGRIFDGETRSGIPGAIIRTEPPSDQVSTDQDGYYRVTTDVQIGEIYTVFADATGYEQNKASVSVREGENAAVDIQLTQAGPVLDVDSLTMVFGAQNDTLPLVLRNRGTGNLNYSIATSGAEWLGIDGGRTGVITDTAVTTNIRVNRTGLGFGEYSGQLVVTSNGGDATVVVSLEVLGMDEPRLAVNPTQLDFGTDQTRSVLSIENFGTGTLSWRVVDLPPWLTASPTEGESTGEADQVALTVDRSRLAPGENFAEFTVGSNHQDIIVPVKATVDSMGSGDGPDGRPMDFAEGEIVARSEAPVPEACALAADRGSLWFGDCAEARVFKQAMDGSIERDHALPVDGEIIDLARNAEALFVLAETGRDRRIWRLDLASGQFSDTEVSSTQIVGIAFDGTHLCTWQGNGVYRRNPETLAVEVRAIATETAGAFAYSSGQFFSVKDVTMDGIYFQVDVQTYHASNNATVRALNRFTVPVDASQVAGIAAEDEYLWILGDGVGEDGQNVVKVRLR